MKTLLAILAIATLLFVAACGDDDDDDTTDTATPSSAASASAPGESEDATPTPAQSTGEPTDAPDLTSFATFAQQIDTAVQQQDATFFSNLGVETTITCTGNEIAGPCEGQPINTTITGIPSGIWQSDAGGYTPISAYATEIAQWFASAMPSQSDSYGDGTPRLHGIAADSTQGDNYAIVTLIVDLGSSTGVQRQARAFRFAPDNSGGYELTGEILAGLSLTADDWLSGTCTECYYDSYQAWP